MLRRIALPLAALSLVLAVSCGPSYRPIQVRTVTEAEYLQAEAAAINLQGEEITIAEGFLAKAKVTGSAKESADYADIAAAYYRVALARHALAESGVALADSEAALTASQERVETYSKVLERVNANAAKEAN
ncbi:MAG: hypothetical protein LBH93_02170 [Chitinispirillales bacterium]|jgi:hypothetical protein|nr:hypothetical protein [Chitinispirillales bacterium]